MNVPTNELRKIPFVRLVIPLIPGLVTGLYLEISFILLVCITCILILLFITILFVNKLSGRYKYRMGFGLCANIFIIVAGILLIKSKLNYPDKISGQISRAEYYLCKIINQPDRRSGTVKVLLRIISYKDSISWYKCKTNMQAYFQKDNKTGSLSCGNIIIIKSELQEFNNLNNPCEFDYKRFMEHRGIKYRSFIKTGTWETIGQYNGLKIFAVKLRNKLLGLYRIYGIKDKEFAVLSAFTLGYRDELNPEIRQAFISAGAMHFLAVSGLHVGIIFYVLNILFGFLRKIKYGKSVKLILIILILWSYALLTGLSPSVLRASAMFTLIQIGISFNRTINIYNILAVTAFLILIYNPLQISDAGFQLSFLAVLSIFYFQPLFYKLLIFKNRILDKVWMISTVSVSAQLGVFPVIIYYYHHFPVYFWLTNILIIIPLALSMYLAIVLFIIYPIGQVAFIIAEILKLILRLINFFIMTVEKLPASIIENIYNNLVETILLYLLIITISMFVLFKHRRYLNVSLLCIICFLSVNLQRDYKMYRQKKIIVFNINDHTVVNFIKGSNSYLLTDLSLEKENRILLSSVQNYWLKHGVSDFRKVIHTGDSIDNTCNYDNTAGLHIKRLFDNMFINFRGKRLLLLSNSDLFEYSINKKLKLDYLIIANNLKLRIKTITTMFDTDRIIIDSSNDFRTRQFWDNECKSNGIDYNIISVEGAFEIEL